MANGLEVTVKDVLSRKIFEHARLLAGEDGLHRDIKWTHILETEDFDSLINGGELILTTGSGINLDSSAISTFKKLIDKQVAGICIEKGPYFNGLSPEIKELADHYQFPVIVFEQVVKFVEITQDLHTFIINRHYEMLNEISMLTKTFTEHSLSPNGILKILQEVHDYFQQSTLFIAEESKPYYYPPEAKSIEHSIRARLNQIYELDPTQTIYKIDAERYAITPVVALGQVWGYLVLHMQDSNDNEFLLFSVLDRAALAITQILLRNRTIEERKLNMEDELVNNLLQGKHFRSEDLQTIFPSPQENLHFRTFLIQTPYLEANWSDEEREEIKVQQSILFRTLFKRNGCFPAVSVRKNEIAVICHFFADESIKNDTTWFSQIIEEMMKIDEKNTFVGSQCTVGVSSVQNNLADIAKSYDQAKEVLRLSALNLSETWYYDKIGIYRLLLQVENQGSLQSFTEEYLGPLIEHDQHSEIKLLNTLKVFLECRGSKKETADQLYIVRQTLYNRLRKIEQLLQMDFMEPLNRISIETAIRAHQLIQPQS